MICPYRKLNDNQREYGSFPEASKTIRTIEHEYFPECQGDECPLFNAKMTPPCMRAVAERNQAYILIKREEN